MSEQRLKSFLNVLILQRFVIAILVAGLTLWVVVLALYRQDVANRQAILAKEAQYVLDLQKELLVAELRSIQSDLLYLSTQDNIHQFLHGEVSARNRLEMGYVNFAKNKAVYDQIRVLDSAGEEMVRVNYHKGETAVVPAGELQSKSSRYYFQQALLINEGEVLVSPFDLNVEHGQIERPIEPVIRFITPVMSKSGEKEGFLILNYLGRQLLTRLEHLSSSFSGTTMLINREGEYLQAPDSRHEWGWLLGHAHNFRSSFPEVWNEMGSLSAGRFRRRTELFTFQRLSPDLHLEPLQAEQPNAEPSGDPSELILISHVSAAVAHAHSLRLLKQLLLLCGGVMALVALLAFHWARAGEVRRKQESQIAESESRLRKLSSALLEAQESERRSLSRVLHDELGQLVTALRLDLGSMQNDVVSGSSRELLKSLIRTADKLLESLHEIASSTRPRVLDELGLQNALESLFSEYQRRTEVKVTPHFEFNQHEIPPKIAENTYRIIAEALSNVARHAKVGDVTVAIQSDEGKLHVVVEDFGVGFFPDRVEASARLGVLGMRERAKLLGGALEVSSSPGSGTRIEVELPLETPVSLNVEARPT